MISNEPGSHAEIDIIKLRGYHTELSRRPDFYQDNPLRFFVKHLHHNRGCEFFIDDCQKKFLIVKKFFTDKNQNFGRDKHQKFFL